MLLRTTVDKTFREPSEDLQRTVKLRIQSHSESNCRVRKIYSSNLRCVYIGLHVSLLGCNIPYIKVFHDFVQYLRRSGTLRRKRVTLLEYPPSYLCIHGIWSYSTTVTLLPAARTVDSHRSSNHDSVELVPVVVDLNWYLRPSGGHSVGIELVIVGSVQA